MGMKKIALKNQDTYVYIDVSNIRLACQKTLGKKIDFVKLLEYFKRRYVNLREVRYYEGIANDDEKKRRMFSYLERKGYTVCALERKSYNSVEIEGKAVTCPRCGNGWTAKFTRERKVMKSNVDVYLAADMVAQASMAVRPTRLILVSCDGDYAEAIKRAVELNDKASVSVLATPPARDIWKNTLSVRLKSLCGEVPGYQLHNIADILPLVESEEFKHQNRSVSAPKHDERS